MNIIRAVATHSGQLERWLGKEEVEHVSSLMKDWYGPPIALAGVPGKVFAHRGGDFRGPILSGRVATARCAVESFVQRVKRGWRHASRSGQLNVGFASLSDLIAEATAGKARHFSYLKGPVTGVVGVSSSLLQLGSYPPAAANASAAPGGDVPVDSTTGFFQFVNPTGGDTQHFVSGFPLANVSGQTNLLYDCLFRVNKTINSTATEAVTGVPTRYQSTTAGADDTLGGISYLFRLGEPLSPQPRITGQSAHTSIKRMLPVQCRHLRGSLEPSPTAMTTHQRVSGSRLWSLGTWVSKR